MPRRSYVDLAVKKVYLKRKAVSLLNVFFVLLILQPAVIFAMEENSDLNILFEKAGVQGTFVLYDLQEKRFIGHDEIRAEKRYIPASTFKIANSLIGLATGAVKDVDELIPYTGAEHPFIPQWKEDMGLKKAIKLSNVPIYQELARRIGLKRMQEQVSLLHYGNEKIGNTIDRFWLDGPLEISAMEQVGFLRRLVTRSLPYSDEIQESVHDILLIDQDKDWKLYGKTGWQNAPGKGVGWFVGWLEKSGKLYVFALNIDINDVSDASKRVELSRECLHALGLL
jgi:beta-lactamase class D